jgi:hypothetical protein
MAALLESIIFCRALKYILKSKIFWSFIPFFSNFSKSAGEVVEERHSRVGGNPQMVDNIEQMDPRLRGGDGFILYLPALFEKLPHTTVGNIIKRLLQN